MKVSEAFRVKGLKGKENSLCVTIRWKWISTVFSNANLMAAVGGGIVTDGLLTH